MNTNLLFRNSSIYYYCLILLTGAVVIVQALASSSGGSTFSRHQWGVVSRGGSTATTTTSVVEKNAFKTKSSSATALSMAEGNEEMNEATNSSKEKVEIPSPIIRPLNEICINNSQDAAAPTTTTKNNNNIVLPNTSSSSIPTKAKKTILTQGGFADSLLPATYVAETNLPTDIGHFRIRAYRIEELDRVDRMPHPLGAGAGLGSEPCVIYCTDKPPFGKRGDGGKGGSGEGVPVRIHDQCFTSEVFRSQR
jgi:GTP cyclohydrolase II